MSHSARLGVLQPGFHRADVSAHNPSPKYIYATDPSFVTVCFPGAKPHQPTIDRKMPRIRIISGNSPVLARLSPRSLTLSTPATLCDHVSVFELVGGSGRPG